MYTLVIETSTVTRDSDGVKIEPTSNINSNEYQEYLAWLNAGNLPTEVHIDVTEKSGILDTDDFLARFTNEEQLSILNEEEVDGNIKLILMKLNTAAKVDTSSPEVIDSINYFVYKNLLTSERASEILS